MAETLPELQWAVDAGGDQDKFPGRNRGHSVILFAALVVGAVLTFPDNHGLGIALGVLASFILFGLVDEIR